MHGSSLKIAVVGSGIAGLSAAWLLAQRHTVTLFEKEARPGGHSHTVDFRTSSASVPVDTGFIVYNELCYPNLTALFRYLGVQTCASDMSFSASLDDGALEYCGSSSLATLFAQKRNVLRPRFWLMLRDLLRFYREGERWLGSLPDTLTLGELLQTEGFSAAFRDDHLLPMGAAIWSTPVQRMLDYPARTFLRFCDNHGLLRLRDRPQWRSVVGGSREYVRRIVEPFAERMLLGHPVRRIVRGADGVLLEDGRGQQRRFDHVVLACHADQALAMLADADPGERRLLGSFSYQENRAVLHGDASLMPRRRRAWASWNYAGRRGDPGADGVSVTYWMNLLQSLPVAEPVLVTLNPCTEPSRELVQAEFHYRHPSFDGGSLRAQQSLWQIQGRRRTWFCGSYFGYGFHEDALQSGLDVAERLGGLQRPWQSTGPGGRIVTGESPVVEAAA